ncbi:hypothetical protein AB6A40_008171 [Gnathostoma spinigerum]|uniref:Dystrobrevin n=1 Tax=Gnathostoma spinigerum TaxID=75299 RepID=A0ABD6EQN3_9BILA
MTPSSIRRQPSEFMEWSSQMLPGQFPTGSSFADDEHKLIARYSAKLSGRTQFPSAMNVRSRNGTADSGLDERAMIAQLEEENGEMLREMALLEHQQGLENTDDQLSGLRERKAQLEERMHQMQQTRRHLMQQLDVLMSQLTTKEAMNGGSSNVVPESLSGIGNRVSSAFRENTFPRTISLPPAQLQGDLLHAAEDITSNMSSFVKELDQAHQEETVAGTESS